MNITYPITFRTYRNGQVGAFFSDVPEAITAGATATQALDRAQDALVVALSAYLDQNRPLPKPSKSTRGQGVVLVPPRVAIKIGIHAAMQALSVTPTQLGDRLGIDGRQVRRILDLDHESKLSQLESALAAMGRQASVEITATSI